MIIAEGVILQQGDTREIREDPRAKRFGDLHHGIVRAS
jgi:hypothetical protein